MEHSDPHEATSHAMGEVTSAVIATSLVLIAVFVPVSFFPGTTGILYRQFSLTIAFSIAISAFNALTLSPALSALFLRGEEERPHQLDFLHIRPFSRAFAAFIHGADATVSWMGTHLRRHHSRRAANPLRAAGAVLRGLGATVWMYQHVPTGFIPQEDQGYLMVIVQAPPGSSLEYTDRPGRSRHRRSSRRIPTSPAHFPSWASAFSGASSNAGMMFVSTKPADQRRGKGHTAADIVADLSPKLQMLMFAPNGGLVAMIQPPAVQGVGSFGGFQFDAAGPGQQHARRSRPRGAPDRGRQPRAARISPACITTFSANDPQVLVTIDREKAKAMNIPLSQITDTLGVFMGSEYVNDFDFNNRTYRVFVQADQPFRMTANDLHNYYVRSDSGQMVPLDNLVTVTESSGPAGHHPLQPVPLGGDRRLAGAWLQLRPGTRGHGDLAKQDDDAGHDLQWTGLTLDEIESSGKALIIFGLGILVVYLTLSAQYESFALPFIILLAVPMAVLGALGLVTLRGLCQRCLLPDRPGHAHRPLGEELDSDCRVRRAVAPQGTVHRRGRHRSRANCACGRF